MKEQKREMIMNLLEQLMATMDDVDAKSIMSPMEEKMDEPEMEEMEEEEMDEMGEPVARVVEEKTMPVDKIGEFIEEKVTDLKSEKEEEEEEDDPYAMPWVNELKKKRRG